MIPISPHRAGRLKQNLSGELAFRSFQPVALQAVEIEHTPQMDAQLSTVKRLLSQLSDHYLSLSEEEQAAWVKDVLKQEGKASWELSAGKGIARFEFTEIFAHPQTDDPKMAILDREDEENLRQAYEKSIEWSKELPISGRLLQQVHYVMTRSERYEKLTPGWFRTSPAWLGLPEFGLPEAFFVFPTDEDMTEGFSELEKFIHYDEREEPLLKAALTHYQFEMLHPFLDGNGRVGRILNLLLFLKHELLPAPLLPWSKTLKRFSAEYYRAFEAVERYGDYESWISFYLSSHQMSIDEELRHRT